jgi:hypothetical protein
LAVDDAVVVVVRIWTAVFVTKAIDVFLLAGASVHVV